MSVTYPIHEIFMSFQGEGSAMGRPAFFVRTYGCPVKCHFCDSAGTWHPDYVPKHIPRMTPEFIAQAASLENAPRVVVTGGEPTIFDLEPLVEACQALHIETHLETSGAFPIRGDFDWIVISPKVAKMTIPENFDKADEFKFIIEDPADIAFYTKVLLMHSHTLDDSRPIWLHPEWSKREDRAVLNAIVDAVKKGGDKFRAGFQLHKLYHADALDLRSKPLVPLGGDPKKGF